MNATTWPASDLLDTSHTGILTTLRQDGRPIALPVWFVANDHAIYVRAQTQSAKVRRISADQRCSFLVEQGEHFSELRFAHVSGIAVRVANPGERAAVLNLLAHKYADSVDGGGPAALPDPGPEQVALLKITPTDRALGR